jgi:hypothetical protein
VFPRYSTAYAKEIIMAVSNHGHIIKLTAQGDAITQIIEVQAIVLEHTAAANAVLTDGSGATIPLRTTTSILRDEAIYPKGIVLHGLTATTLSAGAIWLFLC